MKTALILVPLLAACVTGADDELTLDETTSALTGDQVTAMNNAAAGTAITYAMPAAGVLSEVLAPHASLKRTLRARRADGNYVAEVIVPPDPLADPSVPPDPLYVGSSVRLGPATTSWLPPDPCTPPDPCKTKFDVAGANFRVTGTGVENRDGAFIVTVRVTDSLGHVVFDSTR